MGAQGEDMYGAHLTRALKENGEKKITDWMVDRQVKQIYVEEKFGDEKKNLPL